MRADHVEVDSIVIEGDFKYRAQPDTLPAVLDTPDIDGLRRATDRFHDQHAQRFGIRRESEPVDLVTLRVTALGPSSEEWAFSPVPTVGLRSGPIDARAWFRDGEEIEAPVFDLAATESVVGPAFLEDAYTTVAVPPGFAATRDALGGVVMEVGR
jgi:N-methylhydantoinase A